MSEYVTNSAWVGTPGRPDAIDDIADQFERPSAPDVADRSAQVTVARQPRSARGWRSAGAQWSRRSVTRSVPSSAAP